MAIKMEMPDGSIREAQEGQKAIDFVKEISNSLAKKALAVEINGKLQDLELPMTNGGSFAVVTFESQTGKDVYRHTASHVLAQAVKRLFPGVKVAIGPAIQDGFYYDFDVEEPFTPEDLVKIETEMQKIIKANYPVSRQELSREAAVAFFKEKSEPYKVELIEDLPVDAVISMYSQDDFTDLCAGPHLPRTGMLKAVKTMSVAGAYWRGDKDRAMLQRIYATAFDSKEALDAYLFRIEEAKRRDHRKLGKELDLFSLMDEAPGFPFFHPKGMIIRNELEAFWREEHKRRGYEEIRTPIILDEQLWIRSGHYDHYKDNMYFTEIDGSGFAVKPMNCPGGMLMYKRKLHSYRDLPIRTGELGLVHRHELSGALHGLMRVRCFTQDDAHIFMTPEQIKEEIIGVIDLIDYIYSVFGFSYHVELSTKPEKAMGSDEIWETATEALREALVARNLEYRVNAGDGAFYGPKIDFHLTDSLGRTWQCGTIQLDFQMPERFDLNYIGADGEKHRPVMIHRVAFGSIERFIAILTEHFAGAFPAWIAPVQAIVLPLGEPHQVWAGEVVERLRAAGLRCAIDCRNEKIGYKIREAQLEKVPYMLVIGDREAESGQIALRSRSRGDLGAVGLDDVVKMLKEEVDLKKQ
jgi:threonyl-tRNA synthetase